MQVDELQRLQTPEVCSIASELVVAEPEIGKIGKKANLGWNFTLEGVEGEVSA